MRAQMRLRTSILMLFVCGPAWAADSWTTPYPGIQHLYRTDATPNHIHAIKVDLTAATIRLHATKTADRQKTVSAFAAQYGCVVATNADFFSYQGYGTIGLAVGATERWPNSTDTADEGTVAIGRDNRIEISLPQDIVDPPADWMSEVVSGHPLLVDGGVVSADTNCTTSFCNRNPRTAAGLSQDGHTLFLVVVDGRSTVSLGMSLRELADLMVELGAWRALNLDGGGSSTLFVANEGGVQNTPSDGMERVVGNHLGVAVVDPFGTLKGYVREDAITNTAGPIAGATVMLSTGQMATTDANGLYSIAQVPRGDVTIAVMATGFDDASRAVFVAGDTSWGSVALHHPMVMPDGGTADAAAADAAGGGAGGGGAGGAGGSPGNGDTPVDTGGGCTLAASAPTPPLWLLILLPLCATRRLRSRRH